jgi:hypothetical protein
MSTTKVLTKQMLIRVSEEEFHAWHAFAKECGLSPNLACRRIMADACGVPHLIEEVDRRILEGQKERASRMRETLAEKRGARARGRTDGSTQPKRTRKKRAAAEAAE